MKDIRKIDDRLYIGRSETGLLVECLLEYRKDIEAEVWVVYIDNTAEYDSSIFVAYTETLEQAIELAGKVSISDLPANGRYTDLTGLYESMVKEDMTTFLSGLTNTLPTNTTASWQLGYLTALNEMRSHLNTIDGSEETSE